MQIDPAELSSRDAYFAMISTIVPRPIAFVTSMNEAGVVNLAPFSYFNGVCSRPLLVSICIGHRRYGGELVKKDTLRNIEATGEFVIHIPPEEIAQQVNQSSAEYPPEVSELAAVGLTGVPSDVVKVPRIAECPIAFECKLEQVLMLGRPKALTGMVIAEVVRIHIDDAVWDPARQMVDIDKLRPLSRLGGSWYGRTREAFSIPRPDWASKGVADQNAGGKT